MNAGLSGAVKMCLWDATLTNIDSLKKGNADLVLAQKPAGWVHWPSSGA